MQFISRKTADGEEVQMMPKLEAVKEDMQDFIDKIKQAQELNEQRLKPRKIKWNTRIGSRLECVLLKLQRPMLHEEALALSADELYQMYDDYSELCCWIEEETDIAYYKTKPEFCNFASITTNSFEQLKIDGDPAQREVVKDIDVRLSNSLQMASENNEIKSGAAEFRQRSKSGIGYKVQTTTAKEQVIAIPVSAKNFTPIEQIAPPVVPKQIGKGKK